jgi:hypothetical protein
MHPLLHYPGKYRIDYRHLVKFGNLEIWKFEDLKMLLLLRPPSEGVGGGFLLLLILSADVNTPL